MQIKRNVKVGNIRGAKNLKKAMITVKGIQTNIQNEQDTIELMTEGSFVKKGEYYYIRYDETEISGMEGTITTLKVKEDMVILMRFGSNHSKMIFEKGIRHESNYVTPFGNVFLGVKPQFIDVKLTESGGELNLKYALDLNDKIISSNELHLTVREVN